MYVSRATFAITDAAETDAQSRSALTTGRTRSGAGCTFDR